MSDRSTSGSMLGTRLKLSPNEQEIMELNQRISANLESVRHSVGATQVQFIDSVQSDLARAHELLHAFMVTEGKNKVNVYKRQLSRLHKSLDDILGRDQREEEPSEESLHVLPPVSLKSHNGIVQYTTDTVYHCAWSPDGKMVASGCGDALIRVSDVVTGRLIHVLEGHKGDIFCICFSDDGKTLISASKDMTARQWDLTTGKCMMTFVGHTMCLLATAFIDENKIATASQDATLRVWDVKTGNCLIALQPDALPVLCCAFAPNRKVAVTGSSEGTVNMFDCSNAVFIRTLRGHVGAVWCVNYSPNGEMICSSGEDAVVRIWDAETGACIKSFHENNLCTLTCIFSNDSKMVASASVDKTIRIWDVESGIVLRTITGHTSWAFHCSFSPDDKKIMSTSDDRTVRVWCVDTGKPCSTEVFEQKFGMFGVPGADEGPEGGASRGAGQKAATTPFDEARISMCAEHHLPLGLYCTEEKKFICEECLNTHSEAHHVTDALGLSQISERAIQEIVMTFMQSLHGTGETFETHLNALIESRMAARRKVEATMEMLQNAVATRRKQLLKQVDMAYDQALLTLKSQRDTYNKEVEAHMNSFTSEITTGVLCDSYMARDARYTTPEIPLAMQPLEVCYFGSTNAQKLAAEITAMGNVVINASTLPAQPAQPQPHSQPQTQGQGMGVPPGAQKNAEAPGTAAPRRTRSPWLDEGRAQLRAGPRVPESLSSPSLPRRGDIASHSLGDLPAVPDSDSNSGTRSR